MSHNPGVTIVQADKRGKFCNIISLICGSLSPITLLMGLSACADSWRVVRSPDGIYEYEKNPQWVVATMVSAVVIGVIAGVLLLMWMMGRGNTNPVQYWTLILWILECNHFACLLMVSGDSIDDDWLLCAACRRTGNGDVRRRVLDGLLQCHLLIHQRIFILGQLVFPW